MLSVFMHDAVCEVDHNVALWPLSRKVLFYDIDA